MFFEIALQINLGYEIESLGVVMNTPLLYATVSTIVKKLSSINFCPGLTWMFCFLTIISFLHEIANNEQQKVVK